MKRVESWEPSCGGKYHGRFFSFRGMMDRVLFQVVLLGTGFLLDGVGFHGMVIIFGAISVAIVVYFSVQQARAPLAFLETNKANNPDGESKLA